MNEKNEGKELMVPITATAIELYEGGVLDAVLEQIEKKARAHVPDVSTRPGREAIRSNAALVTGSKTYLFKLGKDLTEDHRAAVKKTNDVRNGMEERLNKLKEEVRKPLTDYEEAEKARIAIIIGTIDEFKGASSFEHAVKPAECLIDRLKEIKEVVIDESFGDLANEAAIEKEKCIGKLEVMIADAEEREADEAELVKLRKETAEREEADRVAKEKQDKIDLATQMRKDAELKAQQDIADKQARIDRERDEQIERDRIAQEKKDQESRDREAQLIRDKEEAEERTRRAALEERQRIEREAEEERIAADKREADKQHNAQVRLDAVNALVENSSLTKKQASNAIGTIVAGLVPNVTIKY